MKSVRFIVVSILVLILSACSASNVATIELDEQGEYQTFLKSNNSTLKGRLEVVELKRRQVGALLQVQATLENQWKFELDFQYKLKWPASSHQLHPYSFACSGVSNLENLNTPEIGRGHA